MRVYIQIAAFARAGSFSPYTRVMGVSLCFVHLRKAYGSMRIESRAMAVEMPVRRGSRPRRGSWPNQPLWEHAGAEAPLGAGRWTWPVQLAISNFRTRKRHLNHRQPGSRPAAGDGHSDPCCAVPDCVQVWHSLDSPRPSD